MQRSIYLARLIGPVLVVIGLGMLVNGQVYRAMAEQFLHVHSLIYISGLLTLLAGLALVNAHNVWAGDWRLIITVLGWLGIIGGVFRILVPQYVEMVGIRVVVHPTALLAGGVAVLLLGAVLSYFGYRDAATSPRRALRTRKRSRR
jgi:hypothetical protein